MENSKKEPKGQSVKNDRLENKDRKDTGKKRTGQSTIGKYEYEEDRTTEIRMKPQPFKKAKPHIQEHESDGL